MQSYGRQQFMPMLCRSAIEQDRCRRNLADGTIPASSLLSLLLLAAIAGMLVGCASAAKSSTSAGAVEEHAGTYMVTNGVQFLYGGQALRLYGFAFYPALMGGAEAWSRPDFPHYIDEMIALGQTAGQNLVRPSDFWSATGKGQSWRNPVIWSNLDYLVRTAQRHNMFVIMDLSAYRWFLVSQGLDPYDAANWTDFLDFVGARYADATAVAFYSIVGEPPVPTTEAVASHLVSFYRTLTDELYAADHGHHLIASGGFIHLGDTTPAAQWWQDIYALPHNDIVAFKTYSQHDLDLLPTLASLARRLRKPLADEEFGMPQDVGDATPTGVTYNNLHMSRAQFYATVYTQDVRFGVTVIAFWNLGCQVSASSYEISPLTPTAWHIVSQYGPAVHVPWPYSTAPCQAH